MMGDMFKKAKMMREDVKEQDWGIASAVDDIRTKVVEEGWWQRPEGRAVTDDIQPSTMQSFYQSHATPEDERAPDAKDAEIECDNSRDEGKDL